MYRTASWCGLAYPGCWGKPIPLRNEPPKGGFVPVARGFSRRAGLARDLWVITDLSPLAPLAGLRPGGAGLGGGGARRGRGDRLAGGAFLARRGHILAG